MSRTFLYLSIFLICFLPKYSVNSAQIRLETLKDEEEDSFREVGDYFMIREESGLRLKCSFESKLELERSKSVDDLQFRHTVQWMFKAKESSEWKELANAQKIPVECKIYTSYKMQRAVKKSIGVSCDASMIIKNMFPSDDGEYLCTARLNVTSAKFSDEHSAKVALFADSRGIVTFVIAAVIIAAVAAIVIGAFCCRWAGHRFAWEYDYVEKANDHTSPYITRIDSAEDAASLWHGRARQMSVSSNISGIVMHATNADGMAKLLERLDHIEQDISEEFDDGSELDDAKPPSMDNKMGDEGKFTLVSLPKNSSSSRNLSSKRSSSSDLKRHGSLIGILPSGIGIGSGAVLTGDDEMMEELAAKRRQYADFRAHFKKRQQQHHRSNPPAMVMSKTEHESDTHHLTLNNSSPTEKKENVIMEEEAL